MATIVGRPNWFNGLINYDGKLIDCETYHAELVNAILDYKGEELVSPGLHDDETREYIFDMTGCILVHNGVIPYIPNALSFEQERKINRLRKQKRAYYRWEGHNPVI